MKRSELREMIREELLKEMALTEMAKIQGDLKTAIKRVISANKKLSTSELKKRIKSNENVKKILDDLDQDLYDNQLGRFIQVTRGELELQKRGRKAGSKNEPKDEKE
jgi:hypothetical protein